MTQRSILFTLMTPGFSRNGFKSKNLYEAAGFKTVRLDYVGRSLTAERLLYNVGVISKSPKLKRTLDQLSDRLGLKTWKLHLNLRDMQRVCVQKVAIAPTVSRVAETSRAYANELRQLA